MRTKITTTLAAALVLAVAAGCGGGDDGDEPKAADLIGSYATTVVTTKPTANSGGQPGGKFYLNIAAEDQVFIVREGPGQRSFEPGSPNVVSDGRIVLGPDANCIQGDTPPGKGTYDWKLEDDLLVFTEVGTDPCRDRAHVMASKPWRKATLPS